MKHLIYMFVAMALLVVTMTSQAQEPVKIGFIGTMTTSAGYMGQDELDAFKLAIKQGNGTLGGVPVKLSVQDDGFNPATGKQAAVQMLEDGIRVFTGINFSNVLNATAPTVLKKGAFYISLNAGSSRFAGKSCNQNFFSVADENDDYSEATALAANKLGAKKMVLMALNYQAGRDAVNGFKNKYKGKILKVIYVKKDQSDFSVELARLRSIDPDAVFTFMPGGPGINFAKQLANSGLKNSIKVITPLYSMDSRMLEAAGDAAEGFYLSTQWSSILDNPVSKDFVSAFEKEYGHRPTVYAATSYDTARLIGSALKAADGDVKNNPEAFRNALRKADFKSVRGEFKFAPNHFPVQNWYLVKVERQDNGKLGYRMIETSAEDFASGVGASECNMDNG